MRIAVIALSLIGLFAANLAAEQQPAEPTQRLAWEHAERVCQFVDKGDDNWAEVDKDGKTTFEFRETRRNVDFIELFDKSRGLTLRLYKNAMYLKVGEEFAKYYEGRWVK